MYPTVSIILLNYNGKKFNHACLTSLFQQTYPSFEIIFVDNASTDGSVQEVERDFADKIVNQQLKIVKSLINTGFSEGNNIGTSHANSESLYICLLNNDTTVENDWLEQLITCIENDVSLGGVGSLVLDQGKEEQLKDFYFKSHRTGLNNYLLEPARREQTEEEKNTGIYYTTGIGGCSFLYKKHLVDKPFPDYYFAYAEDTYLSLVILLTGHRLALCSKSIVRHYGSGSFSKNFTVNKAFHGSKNNLSNLYIFHTGFHFICLLPFYLLYQLVKICLSSPLSRTLGLIKALVRTTTHPHKLIAQKNEVTSYKEISQKSFLSQLSSVLFENIYFMQISPWQKALMSLINGIGKLYFKLIGLPVGDK